MRILFLHNNCPAQYRYLAAYLAENPQNDVVFATMNRHYKIANVRHVHYAPTRYAHPQTHHYLYNIENAVLHGQAVYRMARALKHSGFTPDIICAHSGWGPAQFIKDVYPTVPLLSYFEWYYSTKNGDFGFLPEDDVNEDNILRLRMKSIAISLDLIQCEYGICPTQWQYAQFPTLFKNKMTVLHDGVDTRAMHPNKNVKLTLNDIVLSKKDEVITYVARGMEPYRGFPQFMQAVAQLQQRRPHCHVVIVGEDRVCYGRKPTDGQTYKQAALSELSLDFSRVHFLGVISYTQLVNVLQASTIHVYLTAPFVLSWSLLEAMACGCCIVASDTSPVREVITHDESGLLVDFFSTDDLVKNVEALLDNPSRREHIGEKARQHVVTHYAKECLLPQHEKLIHQVIDNGVLD